MLRWAWREGIARITWSLLALAITGNVSLFLYSRQCRYYAVVMLASVAIAYSYRFRGGGLGSTIGLPLVSIVLFATNYMSYAVLYACLVVDYFAWERKIRPLRSAELWWLLLPQMAVCGPIALTWNPFGKNVWDYHPVNWYTERATLFWWNWRDLAMRIRCGRSARGGTFDRFVHPADLAAASVRCASRICIGRHARFSATGDMG